MADLQFTVDTSPMAKSVDTSRGHMTAVTVAVTAMQAAVIAAERKSSKTICENVDNGFYMLVKSQISQKAVAAYTEMTSRQVNLLQLGKALDGVKRQMESDYNMITKRYAKLFQSLNKALETRVKELDRPAMQLAETRKSIVFEKLNNDSSMLFSISNEALPFAHAALSGKLKIKTKETMQTLTDSITENSSFSDKLDSILVREGNELSASDDVFFLPAIFVKTDSLLNTSDSIENVYTAQADIWQNTAPVVSEISRTQNDMKWTNAESGEKGRVRSEFISLCEKTTEDRVAKEMLRLFDESVWEDCSELH